MKTALYLLLGTACLLHAAHMAPVSDAVKRALTGAALIALLLGAAGYYGLALVELSGVFVEDARATSKSTNSDSSRCEPEVKLDLFDQPFA
jgi:H+/gluconate symporter-like permease